MNHQFGAAVSAYRRSLAAPGDAVSRRDAWRRLAAIEWRVLQDDAAATEALRQLALEPEGKAPAALERSRMAMARGDATAARSAAEEALAATPTDDERREAEVAWSKAAIEPALAARVAGRDTLESGERELLANALQRLRPLVDDSPGELEPARLLLAAAALLEDGDAMLAAWRSYYVLLLDDAGIIAAPRTVLGEVLPRWTAAPAPDRRRVADALVMTGFADPAAAILLAKGDASTAAPPRAREIVAYARLLRTAGRLTDEFYRLTAVGKGDPERWADQLYAAAMDAWPQLAWDGAPPPFDRDAVPRELDRRFGAVVLTGRTGGYDSLHYGHRVVDERRRVEQYGCTAEVRFVALDGMMSNGYETWAWDGDAANGGWGEADEITQVRPEYAGGAVRAWRRVSDPARRARVEAEIAASPDREDGIASNGKGVSLRGLHERLELDGATALRDELAARGLAGPALQAAFQREQGKAQLESAIFAHEGRHAIDKRLDPKMSAEELEYRAKHSQVVFAPRPSVTLGSLLGPVGGDTPHGRANLRILRELRSWMLAHGKEIRGFDPARPVLAQIPKLTDDQLRAAFREHDPLAKSSPCH